MPAAGFDASTYLTLPPAGTYQRIFLEQEISSWLIPCTGMLDIAASSSTQRYSGAFIFTNSNGTILHTDWYTTTFNGTFAVAGNFNITLRSPYEGNDDAEFAFAWSCGGTRPDLPSHDLTPAPDTPAPPTLIPRAPCEALLFPPLVATIKAPIYGAEYSECWTFQCVGTVEVTFRNISTFGSDGRVMLQNSDGYVLTSVTENRERYIATYPANGEMTVLLNDTRGYSYYSASHFTFEWECNTGPAVVPAAGFDASTYLTLPPAGTYERMYSEQAIFSWLIPCTGMLDIAAFGSSRYGVEFIFTNSNGTILASHKSSTAFNGTFSVAGNFNITLHSTDQALHGAEFVFAWSCGGTRPDFPSHDLTSAPDTPAPPTVVPLPVCEALVLPPLVASIRAPAFAQYVECWTFQCVGTVEVTFSSLTTSDYTRVALQNSDEYVLTSLTENRGRYIATYPANGEMTVVLNDTSVKGQKGANEFTFEWECNTGPAVVPAAGLDASTYLTLPPAGTYERMFSEPAIYSWLIPCTGMLDIAASSIPSSHYGVWFTFTNSNGTILAHDWHSTTFNGVLTVAGNFNITLEVHYQGSDDSKFAFAWSCGGATGVPWHSVTYAPRTATPATGMPTDLPAGASHTSVPMSPAPDTAVPTSLPDGASYAPGTSAPDTALPTATPTDQPAGATFAPSAPAVKALCTADKDCRSGRLDPKATCNAGTCVCHTQGYVHPTGVPLCLLADDVTVKSFWSSNVVLYVGIGVGVLVVAVCVVAAFCCLQKKQRATVLENPLYDRALEDAELHPTGVKKIQADNAEELVLF